MGKVLNITVNNKIASHRRIEGHIVCWNDDYTINFVFDSEWESQSNKIARFIWNGQYFDQPITGNTCTVPKIDNATQVRVGVYVKGGLRTTTEAIIDCMPSVLSNGVVPHPTTGQNYTTQAEEAADRAKTAEINAEMYSQDASASAQRATTQAGKAKDEADRVQEVVDLIAIKGINLYDPSLQTEETIDPHWYVDGAPEPSGNYDHSYHCTAPIEIEPSKTYSMGYVPAWSDGKVLPWLPSTEGVFFYDKYNRYISKTAEGTFTTPSNAVYMRFNYFTSVPSISDALSAMRWRMMIVEGESLPTVYEAYHKEYFLKDLILEAEENMQEYAESAKASATEAEQYSDAAWNAVDKIIGMGENGLPSMIYEQSANIYDPSLQTEATISPHYYVNGVPEATGNYDKSYNCTAPIEIEPATTYSLGYVPALSDGKVLPWKPIADQGLFFYDKNHNYISKTGVGTFTTPANAKYIRFNYYTTAVGHSSTLSAMRSNLMIVEGDSLPTKYEAFYRRTLQEKIDSVGENINPLSGKVIVNFGDSIFGMTKAPQDISTKLAELTDATVHNCGFSGCRMGKHPDANYDAFSMYRIADAITSRDFSLQEQELANTSPRLPLHSTIRESYDVLKEIDFNGVDIITIAYGTNDFAGALALDNEGNPYDTGSTAGALRYSIEKILGTYPHCRIFICAPTYRFWTENDQFTEDSDTYTVSGKKLTEFVEREREVAKAYHLPFIDNYYEIGINKHNRGYYFPSNDSTHQNQAGRDLIAKHMAQKLF